MASMISGLDNDIFISYRHNDNKSLAGKGEGWVSEFVANLRLELEATVKEKISIYFDENPHDGLLETHNVDASLSTQLKSLIFIPILSQTYCDPESFAWRNEFQAFNKMAADDKFGPTIKLLNGNVSNRVLPVRIHELDPADIKMVEAELGNRLRPVDFIFKSTGVNRPLRVNEEDPLKNANHLLYRDQLNKTANAVKDLILGLKAHERPMPEKAAVKAKPKLSILPGVDVVRIKSMAVLPFSDLSKDPEQTYLSDGIAEELLNSLSRLRDLKVADRISSFQFRGMKTSLREVGSKLSVTTVLDGTVNKQGHQLTIALKISNAQDGSVIYSDRFEAKSSDLCTLVNKIGATVIEKLNIKVSEGERTIINKTPTQNSEAYELFLKGRFFFNRQGVDLLKGVSCFQDAVGLDPEFALAWACLADAFVLVGYYELAPFVEAMTKAKEAALKGLMIDPTLTEAYAALAFINMAYEWNWPEVEPYFNKVFATNPSNPSALARYSLSLKQIVNGMEEASREPLTTVPHFLQAYSLLHRGKFNEALTAAQKASNFDPDSFMAHRSVGLSYLGLEKYDEAIESLLVAARLSNRHPWLLFELMSAYLLSGKQEEAQAVMEEALARSHAIPARISNFFFPSS